MKFLQILIFLIIVISSVRAGDISLDPANSHIPDQFFEGQEEHFTLHFVNSLPTPVNNIVIVVQIKDLNTNEIIFNYNDLIPSILGDTSVQLEVPERFTPQLMSNLEFAVVNFSPEDFNLANDVYTREIAVNEYPDILINPIDFVVPDESVISNEINLVEVRTPNYDFDIFINVFEENEDSEEEWVIKNLPIPAGQNGMHAFANFEQIPMEAQISLTSRVSPEPLAEPSDDRKSLETALGGILTYRGNSLPSFTSLESHLFPFPEIEFDPIDPMFLWDPLPPELEEVDCVHHTNEVCQVSGFYSNLVVGNALDGIGDIDLTIQEYFEEMSSRLAEIPIELLLPDVILSYHLLVSDLNGLPINTEFQSEGFGETIFSPLGCNNLVAEPVFNEIEEHHRPSLDFLVSRLEQRSVVSLNVINYKGNENLGQEFLILSGFCRIGNRIGIFYKIPGFLGWPDSPILFSWIIETDAGLVLTDNGTGQSFMFIEQIESVIYEEKEIRFPSIKIECPADTTIDCDQIPHPDSTGKATVIIDEDCGCELVLLYTEDTEIPGDCPGNRTILRKWFATDNCNNMDSCVQTIHLTDQSPPIMPVIDTVFLTCQESYENLEIDFLLSEGLIAIEDNCSEFEDLDIQFSDQELTEEESCIREISRQWVITDGCGNAELYFQRIVISPPEIVVEWPRDIQISCESETDPSVGGNPIVFGGCPEELEVTFEDQIQAGNCAHNYTIFRTWTVQYCGVIQQHNQMVSVVDNEEPTFVELETVDTIACDATDISPAILGTPVAVDNCSQEVSLTYQDEFNLDYCPGELVRVWLAEDECDNSIALIQIVALTDKVPPVIDCPPDTVITAIGSSGIPVLPQAIGTDNCDPDVEISFTDESTFQANGGIEVQRTWTAVDTCQNSASCVQQITVLPLGNIEVSQYSYLDPIEINRSMEGEITFLNYPSDYVGFLNAEVCLDIEDSESEHRCIWGIQNHIIEPFGVEYHQGIEFDFQRLGFKTGDSIPALTWTFKVTPGIDTIYDPLVYDTCPEITIPTIEDLLSIAADPVEPDNIETVNPPVIQENFFGMDNLYSYTRPNMPNIDLDSMTFNPETIDGYAGDKNACVPAALANSMHWLEMTHDSIEDTGTSLREKLEDMSRRADRDDEEGVALEEQLDAKLSYVNSNEHSIHVKFQSIFEDEDYPSPNDGDLNVAKNRNANEEGWPTWEFLVEEIRKGEDVELAYDVISSDDGSRLYSHMLMISGVRQVRDRRSVSVVDDLDQLDTGGLRNNSWKTWNEDEDGVPYLGIIRDSIEPNRRIKTIISESYDPEITHNIFPQRSWIERNITDPLSLEVVRAATEIIIAPPVRDFLLSINNTLDNSNFFNGIIEWNQTGRSAM